MVEVTYKKKKLSPNPRVAKLRDTGELYNAMYMAAQVHDQILKVSEEKDLLPEEMKPTVIDSDTLYKICDAYLKAYEMLLKENLIKSGNIHKISPTIN